MLTYEYKVVPAPLRGDKIRGAKTAAERFAVALAAVMNDLGREGWEYQRSDTLPCEERVGLTGRSSTFVHMLVFRRPLASGAEIAEPPAADKGPVRPALVAIAPEGAAPKVTAFAKPVVVPLQGPAQETD